MTWRSRRVADASTVAITGRRLSGAPDRSEAAPDPAVPEDAPHPAHAVPPADLLPLGVGASGVRDADLVHAPSASRHLRRHLRLEPEALLLERDRFENGAAE